MGVGGSEQSNINMDVGFTSFCPSNFLRILKNNQYFKTFIRTNVGQEAKPKLFTSLIVFLSAAVEPLPW